MSTWPTFTCTYRIGEREFTFHVQAEDCEVERHIKAIKRTAKLDGELSPSALRTEAAKGNLDIIQIARKDFVTRRAIEEMKQRCLVSRARPASGSEKIPQPGSSRTPPNVSAQDAVRLMLKKRNERSQTTSPANTKRPAEVVPLKSR